MKRFTLTFCLALFSMFSGLAQDLRAELALARFLSPDGGPYLETYLKMDGNSLKLTEDETGFHATVLITYKISKAGSTIYEDAYKLNGPITSEGEVSLDFVDLQRIPMKNGKHELVMTIKDLNNEKGKEAKIYQDVIIEQKLLKVFISDVQLVESFEKTTSENVFSKVGFDLFPYTSNFYPESRDAITFYAEVYNSNRKFGEEDEFLVNMFVENADDGRIVNNLRTFIKQPGQIVVPILHSFPLVDVESGNYNLVIEARDRKNEILDRTVLLIQHSKTIETTYVEESTTQTTGDVSGTFVDIYNRPEELEEYLRCLHPISNEEEITDVNRRMNFNDPIMMKRYMYNFWMQRNPANPEDAWLKYWKEVEKVNAAYSTNINKGYDTDRGRVYLQYGAPNTISPNYFEPNTYPYEIWHYYKLSDGLGADQSNRKFVFANTEQGSKEFNLIHSDAKNEINNRRWNYDLHKRSTSTIDLDQENSGEHYGGRSQDFFENPF